MTGPLPPRVEPTASDPVDSHASVDQRHQGYIALYCNLDTLGWNSQATLMAISLLGSSALGIVLEKAIALAPFSHNDTIAAIFTLMAILYANTLFVAGRMRTWHKRLEIELMALEPSGYFHARQKDKRAVFSARLWSGLTFGSITFACVVAAIYFARLP